MGWVGTIITCLNEQDFWINKAWIKWTALYSSIHVHIVYIVCHKQALGSSVSQFTIVRFCAAQYTGLLYFLWFILLPYSMNKLHVDTLIYQ